MFATSDVKVNTNLGQVSSIRLPENVGEKNAIMDTFVFVVGETGLVQV